MSATTATTEPQRSKAAQLRLLHGGDLLVLPNAWDARSARVFADAGFPAVATTSGGVADALGHRDHQGAPAEEMLTIARRVAGAVEVPVTADLEAGYGLPADELARWIVDAGVAGVNLEDSVHGPERSWLGPAEDHAERIAALRAALGAIGGDLVINARVDTYLHGVDADERVGETIRRARRYREAGADCVYPIGISEPGEIAAVVDAVDAPVNVMWWPGALPLEELARLGVARVSFGSGIANAARRHLEGVAAALRSGDTTVLGR